MTSNKNIFRISYPIFLTLIAQNVINVTDTAFLGRVSEVALGASALAGVLYIAIYMLGFGFSMGAQILIGRRNGEGEDRKSGVIFNNALLFNLLFAAVIFLCAQPLMHPLMKLLVQSESVYSEAISYLDWRIFGLFFSFPNAVFRAFFVGITQTRILSVSALITAITNVLFDYLLIFGHAGLPEMGIAGAGLASVIAEAATFGYLFLYAFFRLDRKRYGLFVFKGIVNWEITRSILDLSVFIMIQYFMSIATWFLFFIFIEHLGERPLAATNIGRSLYILLMMPGSALSSTCNTLVSNLIGAGRQAEVLPFMHHMLKLVLLLALPIALFTFSCPELFARVYTDDPALIAACIPVLRVVSVAMLFCAAGHILFSALTGSGNTRTAFLVEVLTLSIYMAYVYYTAIVLRASVSIIWFSEFIYWGIIGVLAYAYMKSGKWQQKQL